ncbi:MAG: CBS domain-containing protein [Fibrobacter sp.]|jgi:manganese-dependent inorganic pyrophosphatase|nr:CBS domain-containing protein [Fibrobacter sp.]
MDQLELNPIYIAGHLNPDIDSIASAMGYAWLLHERDGKNAIAVRTGSLTAQTSWLLQTLGLEPPMLLNDASPRFNRIARPLPPILPDRPLHEALSIISSYSIGVPIVGSDNVPLGLVTGGSVFKLLSNQIRTLVDFEKVSVATLLSIKCRESMDPEVPRFPLSMRVSDARRKVLNEERNDFIVTRDDGTYFGVCRSPDVLTPPKMQLILVDHNEVSQSIRALEEAELIEVIDHHRVGTQSTITPIPFYIDCVGSTSTLISERIIASGLMPPPAIVALLLAGVISDTLLLASPTTTKRDHIIVERLMELVRKSGILPYKDHKEFGDALFSVSSSLSVLSPDKIVTTDLKLYNMNEKQFGLAQIEVGNLNELGPRVKEISEALEELCESKGLEFAVLMVTDVVRANSRLVVAGNQALLKDLPYTPLADHTMDATGIVSRKKQLLPVILGFLE